MTKNKEIFEKIVAFMKAQIIVNNYTLQRISLPYKINEKSEEEFVSYSFRVDRDMFDLAPAKEICNRNKWKQMECGVELARHYFPDTKDIYLPETPSIINEYYTVLYDGKKDKVSISYFEVGYAFGYHKQRYYPFKKNTPVFCLSKHFYLFTTDRRENNRKAKVRHWKPFTSVRTGMYKVDIEKIILGIDYTPELNVVAKHYRGTQGIWDVVHNIHGIKIPKVLRTYPVSQINDLLAVLKNKNEINSVCQQLTKNPEKDIPGLYREISNVIARMTIGIEKSWLIRDYMRDLVDLKKTFSLNVKSVKRIEDEHRKMSMEKMLRGVPEIKPDARFKKFSEQLKLEHEFIDTKERLMAESYDQHHCVSGRATDINWGKCGIFCIHYNGARYTLDVRTTSNTLYYPYEFRGVNNCTPPQELIKMLDDEITRINFALNNKVKFVKPVEVPQIDLVF